MSTIYNDLHNSGQAFLYVFVSPKAILNSDIMTKRAQRLGHLNEMYARDQTYTPVQMIQILRDGITSKYGKSPELILQIIFDNAVNIDSRPAVKGIGATTDTGVLTFDSESNQYYDGSGNAYLLDSAGNVASKNGQSTDLKIDSPATLDDVKVGTSAQPSFWDDVASVIDWIVGIFQKLGITKTTTTIATYVPGTSDWTKLNTSSSMRSAGIGDYLPYVIGAGIVYTLITGTGKKSKSKQK